MPDVLPEVLQLIDRQRFSDAEALLRAAIAKEPARGDLVYYLAVALQRQGRSPEALELLLRVVETWPTRAEVHYQLGGVYRSLGRLGDAIRCFKRAAELKPDLVEVHLDAGAVLAQLGQRELAWSAFRQAVKRDPTNVPARVNLGYMARRQGRLDEAIQWLRGVTSQTTDPAALSQLGSVLRESGRIEEAVDCFRRAVELKPDFRVAHSNLVYALQYDPRPSAETVFDEHVRWARRHADPLAARSRSHENDPGSDRRLRIGYSGATFGRHVTGFCLEPVLRSHDRAQFEIVCYSDVEQPDEVTERFRSYAKLWRDTRRLSDEQLAEQVRSDQIDIFVDLTLHMGKNRLAAFARRPAPVQVTYLAYPGTSGMRAMDWAISDVHLDPPGASEMFHTERIARLPDTYWCYSPAEETPEVSASPVLESGRITFGSLNSFAKINEVVLGLWSRLLAAVPDSRLAVLIVGGAAGSPSAVERLARHGISPDRLTIFDVRPRNEYLKLYHQIDIALDPFPYGGHTTSLDALWMGVPLVSLVGKTAVGRAGVTMLTHVGLTELLASTPDEYVRIAVELARDRQRLESTRASLRSRMLCSPLTDAGRYTKNLEHLYRSMWRDWCENSRGTGFQPMSGDRA